MLGLVVAVGLVQALAAGWDQDLRLAQEVELVTKWARNETKPAPSLLSTLPVAPILLISSVSARPKLTLLDSDSSFAASYETGGWRDGKWTLRVEELKVGKKMIQADYKEMRLDWEREGIWGPAEIIASMHARIAANRPCSYSQAGALLCDCSSPLMPIAMYPTISFVLPQTTLELSPQLYMQRNEAGQCLVALWGEQQSYWSLGTSLLSKYSVLLNPQSLTVGFSPNPDSSLLSYALLLGTALGLIVSAEVGRRWRQPAKRELLLEYDYLGLRIH